MFRSGNVSWLVLCAILIAGCEREYVPVSGVVTFKGEPLTSGMVSFHNTAWGPVGYATINRDGHYSAKTGTKSGLRPGEYRVTVAAHDALPVNNSLTEQVPALLTPYRYSQQATSGLRCTVTPSEKTFDIALESK